MKITEINPYTVMERFPEYQDTIKQLFKSDPNFQTLCFDYLKCSKALNFWDKSDLCEASKRREEYKILLEELEAEILGNVQTYDQNHAE